MLERCFYAQESVSRLIDNAINYVSEFILSAIDNEVYHFKGMLWQPDRAAFIEAIEKEIDANQRQNHWKLCERLDVPKGMKTIMSMWAFKRKCLLSSDLLKHKAWICAHGGQQQ